jgi:hypothetical protein
MVLAALAAWVRHQALQEHQLLMLVVVAVNVMALALKARVVLAAAAQRLQPGLLVRLT